MAEAEAVALAVRAGATVFSGEKSTLVQTGPRPLVPGGSGLEQLRRTTAALDGAQTGVVVAGAVPFDLSTRGPCASGRPRPARVT